MLDFGIAVAAADGSDLAGTVDYMAPELLRRQPATVSSDLYAVGVLMHQVLTGVFPYSRESMTQMLGDILGEECDQTLDQTVAGMLDSYRTERTSRQRASAAGRQDEETERDAGEEAERKLELSLELPAGLAAIVSKLLSRRPEDRYKDAGSVLRDLSAAVHFPLPLETAATRESFLQATELVGREAELALLKEGLERAKAGESCGYLIGGESGIGKSRIISELRTQALVRGFWVAEGQSVTEGGAYYQEWLPLLRALCFRVELSPGEASIYKDVLPDISELLGREVADPPKVKPEEMQTRLGSTLTAALERVSKPLLLILEDLQWGRKESLALLEQLSKAKGKGGHKVLLVGTHRTDESPDLPQKLPELQSVVLKRLGTQDIARLSERMLGAIGKKAELVEYLQRQTEGNVFFLIEIVRALADHAGELRRIGDGVLPEQVLTVGIERIVERRLEQAGAACTPLLEFSAAMGRRLDLLVLEKVHSDLPLRTLLDECANCAVLETKGSDWRFAHDKLRETILRRIDPERRRLLHRQIGEGLESVYVGAERDSLCAQLAFHYAHGQRPDRACLYYAQAGEQAARLGLLTEARSHYRDALKALAELPDTASHRQHRLDVLLKLLYSSLTSDSLEVQLSFIKEAQGLLDSFMSPDGLNSADRIRQARLDFLHGRANYYAGRPAEALRLFQRVLPIASETGDLELLAIPSAATGMALCSQGYMGKAYPYLARAVEPLRQLGNFFEEARTRIYIAVSRCLTGMYREGMRDFDEQEARVKEIKQVQLIPISRIIRALAQRGAMHWTAILETVAGIGDAAIKLGEKPFAILPWSVEAWALMYLGRYEEGTALRKKALVLAGELGGKYVVADWFAAGDAEMAALRGDFGAALELARAVAETSTAAGLPLSLGIAERAWALAQSRLGGTLDEVEAHLRASLAALALGELRLDIGQTELAWGRILAERGDLSGAQTHFQNALSIFKAAGCEQAVAEVRKSLQERD